MRFPNEFGLYGILTNPVVGYERLAEAMVAHKIRFIQLRMKDAPREEVLKTARNVRDIVTGESLLIVNDDPEIAAEVGADGVHLGQDDMPFEEARRIVGEDAIIGLSTHNPDQTTSACVLKPDYIGVGPVYATPTKKIPDPPLGIDGMKEMLRLATVPAVVLGSIDETNASGVLAGGARNICCVRYINQSEEPGRELQRIKEIISSLRSR